MTLSEAEMLVAASERAFEDVRRAAREYRRLYAVWRGARQRVVRGVAGSEWDVSVHLNETVHGGALPADDTGGTPRVEDMGREAARGT